MNYLFIWEIRVYGELGREKGGILRKQWARGGGSSSAQLCGFFLDGCEKATLFLSVHEDHRASLYQTAHGEKLGEQWTEALNNLKFTFKFRVPHPKLNMDDILVTLIFFFFCFIYTLRFLLLFVGISEYRL